jgi:hypothetical protein
LEIWGQWVYSDKVSGRFVVTYAGKPSLFEGKTFIPEGTGEVKLQLLAADQAGNFGQHIISYRLSH